MINDLITFVGVTVFWCLGIYTITDKGMIGYPIRKFVVMKFPEWIQMPTFTCITCMASFHGMLMFLVLLLSGVIQPNFVVLVLGCVMAAFLQTFLMSVVTLIKRWILP